MKLFLTILLYALAVLLAPVVLLFYGNWKWALLAFLLNLTVVGVPVSSALGVIGTYRARHPVSVADEIVGTIANASVTHTP